ncbi:hypothetical protein [Microvirga calopogonii]|uniref:hypothetical protein n=1 Tax=Microvirga calopogonii TaxID=2078013 RepID=UPI000E0D2822|nr:hypothetical protein [Microvirga calopogonii]
MTRDPRSEAEKARADLARNAELGLAVPESPVEERPSVTPETFGDTTELARKEARDQAAARRAEPLEEDDGDSTGTGSIPRSGRVPVYPDETVTERPEDDEDILSRAKE